MDKESLFFFGAAISLILAAGFVIAALSYTIPAMNVSVMTLCTEDYKELYGTAEGAYEVCTKVVKGEAVL